MLNEKDTKKSWSYNDYTKIKSLLNEKFGAVKSEKSLRFWLFTTLVYFNILNFQIFFYIYNMYFIIITLKDIKLENGIHNHNYNQIITTKYN